MIATLLSRWKLIVVAVLLLALGAVWWMYRAEIERRVDMALRAGEITQALEQAESDKAALVEARKRNDRLQREIESIREESRRRVEAAEERLSAILESDQEARDWHGRSVPLSVRDWMLNDTSGDGETRDDSPAPDDDPAVSDTTNGSGD